MTHFNDIIKTANFLFAVFFVSQIWSQKYPIVLLPGSQKIDYNKKTGEHRLSGTVNFTYRGNTMYCDSASYNEKSQTIKAYGNVHVQKEDINLYCDSFYYKTSIKYAKLWGHVRIRDSEYKISTDSIDYDAKNGKAIYRNFGRIESISSSEKISSKTGYFYPETKNVAFGGKVKYSNGGLTMTTDTLRFNYSKQIAYFFGSTFIKNDSVTIKCKRGWYDIKKERAQLFKGVEVLKQELSIHTDTLYYDAKINEFKAKGNAKYIDYKEEITITGRHLFSSDILKLAYASGNASAIKVIKEDTLVIQSDSIKLFKDSLLNIRELKAFKDVKIWYGKISGKSDSSHYSIDEKLVKLRREPIIWMANTEMKGDSMNLYVNDSIIDSTLILGNSTVIMEVDSGKYYNQVSGKTIHAYFSNDELTKIDVKGNAWTIFYPVDEQKKDTLVSIKRYGMNRLFASELRIYLEKEEVHKITYFDKPDGIFYPIDKIDEKERWIKGFSWNPHLRPKRTN